MSITAPDPTVVVATPMRHGPVTVNTYTGPAVILTGHGLSAETTDAAVADHFGPVSNVATEEVFWRYLRRVKWCARFDWPCDSEGEWHGHWYPVTPSDDTSTHFTVAWHVTHEETP